MKKSSIRCKVIKRFTQERHSLQYQDVGSLIKERRKELKLTQELISNGICSISYLSKIENNQISPNEFFVQEIMEKLDVDKSVYQKTIDDHYYLEEMISHIFYDKQCDSKLLFEEIKGFPHNIVFNICKLGYISHHFLWDDDQFVMMLELLIQNMSEIELKAYLVFAIMYNVSNSSYKQALDLYMTFKEVNMKHDMLDALANEYAYRIHQELNVNLSSYKEFDIALNLYQKSNNFRRAIQLKLQHVSYLIEQHHVIAIEALETVNKDTLSESHLDVYHILLAKIKFIEGFYKDATLVLSNIKDTSKNFYEKMVLLYEICLKESDESMKHEIAEIIANIPHDKLKIKAKIYYHFLLQSTRQDRKEYLREIAIPFSVKVGDMKSLYMYTDVIMDLCIDASRYKEATLHYKKYKKEVGKIQNIIS